jgi:hypothetical protein
VPQATENVRGPDAENSGAIALSAEERLARLDAFVRDCRLGRARYLDNGSTYIGEIWVGRYGGDACAARSATQVRISSCGNRGDGQVVDLRLVPRPQEFALRRPLSAPACVRLTVLDSDRHQPETCISEVWASCDIAGDGG